MGTLRRTAVVSLLLAPLLAAGCSGGGSSAAPEPGSGSAAPTQTGTGTAQPGLTGPPSTGAPATGRPPATRVSGSPGPVVTVRPPTGLPVPPPTFRPPAKQISIVGDVVQGVEAGCYLLTMAGGKQFLLLGANVTNLKAGGRVKVTGRAEPDLVTTCQQGIPFIVVNIAPA